MVPLVHRPMLPNPSGSSVAWVSSRFLNTCSPGSVERSWLQAQPPPPPPPRRSAAPASAASDPQIVVRGAREHNLKNVNVELPRDKLVVFTGSVRFGEVEPGLRHDLCGGAAPLRRVAELLCPPVPRPDGQARRRRHRRPVAGDLDRPEVGVAQPAIDRRHDHRGLRLPPPALRPHRRAALPQRRDPAPATDPAADRRSDPRDGRGGALPGARPGRARPEGRVRHAARGPVRSGIRACP